MQNLPALNSVVVFTKVGASSYLTAGDQYRVTHISKRTVTFTSVNRGSSTNEEKGMLLRSMFECETVIPA